METQETPEKMIAAELTLEFCIAKVNQIEAITGRDYGLTKKKLEIFFGKIDRLQADVNKEREFVKRIWDSFLTKQTAEVAS